MDAGNAQNSNLLFSKVGHVQSLSNLSPEFLTLEVLNPALSGAKQFEPGYKGPWMSDNMEPDDFFFCGCCMDAQFETNESKE